MSYDKQTWADGPAGGTPISAVRLTYIETGIEGSVQTPVEVLPGDLLRKTPSGWEPVPADAYLSAAGVVVKGSSSTADLLPGTADPGDAWLVNEQLHIWINNSWQNVGNITAVKGPPGMQGVQGPAGAGLRVLGSLATTGDLPAGADAGDAYLINQEMHIWDGAAWNNVGNVGLFSHSALADLGEDDHPQYALVSGGRKISISAVAPVTPSAYDVWVDINQPMQIKSYINSVWSPVAGSADSARFLQDDTASLPVADSSNIGTFYWVTDGGEILYSDGNNWNSIVSMFSHGDLSGLEQDHHPQYHNDQRGDARYANLTGATFTGNITVPNASLGVGDVNTTSGLTTLDMTGPAYQKQATLTGDVSYDTVNKAPGRTISLRVINGSFDRELTFPSGWAFLGEKPIMIEANKIAILSITSFGSTDSECVAAWSVTE